MHSRLNIIEPAKYIFLLVLSLLFNSPRKQKNRGEIKKTFSDFTVLLVHSFYVFHLVPSLIQFRYFVPWVTV